MRMRMWRGIRRLALVVVALPVAAWALERVARRVEAGDGSTATSQRLRQAAGFLRRFSRGPLAKRLDR